MFTGSLNQSEKIEEEKVDEIDEEEMMKMLGFSSFTTTKVINFLEFWVLFFFKGKSHAETTEEAVLKSSSQKRKYRQYMNRRGGFNRALDKMV